MIIPILNKPIDERFLNHRRESTSLAGMVSTLLALALFAYRFYGEHVVSWDLAAVIGTFMVIKMTVLIWRTVTD